MVKRTRTDSDEDLDEKMNILKACNTGVLGKILSKPQIIARSVIQQRMSNAFNNHIPKHAHLSTFIPFPTEHNFVSPSSLFHFVKQDPFQDVLNAFSWYFVKKFNDGKNLVHDSSSQFIMDKGNEFELEVKNMLINANFNMTEIPKRGDDIQDSVLYEATIRAMEKGYDIIYQGCVFNPDMNLYGHPDFLIRSDKINAMDSDTPYPANYIKKSSRFGQFHYVVFDTKFRTIEFNSAMEKMTNTDAQRYYKVQLYVYSKCLEYIQGCLPAYGYIIGRGHRSELTIDKQSIITSSNNVFDMFGPVDMLNINSETHPTQLTITELIDGGIKWINTLKTINKSVLENVNWQNPIEPYFRPNMQNKYTSNKQVCDMYNIKRKIAIMQGEPTILANIGSKQRALLHSKGIYSIYDKRCTTTAMGFNNGDIKTNLDLQLMQFNDVNSLVPDIYCRHIGSKKLKNQTLNNRDLIKELNNNGYFVTDFETRVSVSDKFDNLPTSDTNTCVYLIGLIDRYNNVTQSTSFIPFVANNLSDTAELHNFKQFIDYMKPYYALGNGPKLLTWSTAENKFIDKLMKKYNDILSDEDKFIVNTITDNTVDMLELFIKEHIMIKNCYTLSLKDVAKQLYNMGLIKTVWTDNMSGLAFLSTIDKINDVAVVANITLSEHPDFVDIVEYNRIDCQVIVEIVEWLFTKIMSYQTKSTKTS